MRQRLIAGAFGLAVALHLGGCSGGVPDLTPATQPLSKETMMQLGKKGMSPDSPIFVRIFKEESELEVWKQRNDGRFYHFKTYPVCNWSGEIGPKVVQGDRQAPEGFYTIQRRQMNPNSHYYLAFDTGFPNAYDRSLGRTGSNLMVHGKCKSAGCYAMTDALIEEIYALARESFNAGQPSFEIHAYPFRMTEANMAKHRGSPWYDFWRTLKEGSDYFEATRVPPNVVVCNKRYQVNVRPIQTVSTRLDPSGQCPALERMPITPFVPSGDQQTAENHIVAPGPRMRAVASAGSGTTVGGPITATSAHGLTNGTLGTPQTTGFGFTQAGD